MRRIFIRLGWIAAVLMACTCLYASRVSAQEALDPEVVDAASREERARDAERGLRDEVSQQAEERVRAEQDRAGTVEEPTQEQTGEMGNLEDTPATGGCAIIAGTTSTGLDSVGYAALWSGAVLTLILRQRKKA